MQDDSVNFDPPPDYAPHLLTTLHRVAARVPNDIITQSEIDLAYEMILSASLQARDIGNAGWTQDTVPLTVSSIVTDAAARGFMNPEGFNSEGNDGVSFGRGYSYAQGADLTAAEQRRVKSAAGRAGFIAVQASKPDHWHARSDTNRHNSTHYVPWTDQLGRKEFPFGSDEEFKGAW